MKPCCRTFSFTFYKAFFKNKKRSETSLPASFFAWFLKKNISIVSFYTLEWRHCWLWTNDFWLDNSITLRYVGNIKFFDQYDFFNWRLETITFKKWWQNNFRFIGKLFYQSDLLVLQISFKISKYFAYSINLEET